MLAAAPTLGLSERLLASALMVKTARAQTPGLTGVAGVNVFAFVVGANGVPGTPVAATKTLSNGSYQLTLPSGTALSNQLLVQASVSGAPSQVGRPNGIVLNAPGVRTTVNLTPASEYITRMLIAGTSSQANLSNLSTPAVAELMLLMDQILSMMTFPSGTTIDVALATIGAEFGPFIGPYLDTLVHLSDPSVNVNCAGMTSSFQDWLNQHSAYLEDAFRNINATDPFGHSLTLKAGQSLTFLSDPLPAFVEPAVDVSVQLGSGVDVGLETVAVTLGAMTVQSEAIAALDPAKQPSDVGSLDQFSFDDASKTISVTITGNPAGIALGRLAGYLIASDIKVLPSLGTLGSFGFPPQCLFDSAGNELKLEWEVGQSNASVRMSTGLDSRTGVKVDPYPVAYALLGGSVTFTATLTDDSGNAVPQQPSCFAWRADNAVANVSQDGSNKTVVTLHDSPGAGTCAGIQASVCPMGLAGWSNIAITGTSCPLPP
jgi:hypothetical protein